MLYHLETVKANIRNRDGKRVFYLGKGDQLTSEARDHLNRERIEILPAEQAKPAQYRLPGGGYVTEKPEHMTHLHGDVLVCKTHPRIAFRGAIDTLEAEILLCQKEAEPELRAQLEEVLTLARKIIRWEVMEEPAEEMDLCGLTGEQLRQHSHRPQEFYGQPHFMPSAEDSRVLLLLNRVRCAARDAELKAVAAFLDPEGRVIRQDLLTALNRMSSMLYLFMIREKGRRS